MKIEASLVPEMAKRDASAPGRCVQQKIAQRKMPYIRRSNYYGGVKQHSIQNNRSFTHPVELLRRPFKNTQLSEQSRNRPFR